MRPIYRIQNAGSPSGYDEYLERLMKMIPGEAVGLYLVGNGALEQANAPIYAWWVLFIAGLALTVLVRAVGSKGVGVPPPSGKPQWSVVIVSSVSYCIYIYALPNGQPFGHFRVAWIASLAVLIWTAFIPYIQPRIAMLTRDFGRAT